MGGGGGLSLKKEVISHFFFYPFPLLLLVAVRNLLLSFLVDNNSKCLLLSFLVDNNSKCPAAVMKAGYWFANAVQIQQVVPPVATFM
mgnify:CR=1 FL=1